MKIAVIRFSALGDIAAAIPAIKTIKHKPVIISTKIGKELLKDEFDEFIILKSKKLFDVINLILKIRKMKFDLLIDLQGNDRSQIITKFSNVNKIVNSKGLVFNKQATLFFYDIIKKTDTEIFDEINIKFNKSEKKYLVFNCGSSQKWVSKRLPIYKWKEFADYLNKRFNLPIYLVGDKSEIDYLEKISNYLEGDIKNLAGKTSIQELKRILRNAYLTISTDSAAMHISAIQGTPTIGIFGATNWQKSAPFGPWSTVLFDKTVFKDNKPLETNTMKVNSKIYDNINIEDGLNKIDRYL